MLRLNLEATTQAMMEEKRDEVLAFIQESRLRVKSADEAGLA